MFTYFGYRLPLAGGGLEPDIPIGGYALPVLYDTNASLVTFRIKILGEHYIYPLVLKVALFIKVHTRLLRIAVN
jgi:hypothetical protein